MSQVITLPRDPFSLPTPPATRTIFQSAMLVGFWTAVRLYTGFVWLAASWEKLRDPRGVWVGERAGAAVAGFVQGALAKTSGEHPDVMGWYASFLREVVLPHPAFFSYVVTFGELAVGIALLVGLFTGIAAFFGGFMNVNFMLAGTCSINPLLFVLATWLVLAWRVAGEWGLDHWALRRLGSPGAPRPRLSLFAAFRAGSSER